MGISKASAHWGGTIRQGNGGMEPEHAAEIPFCFASRFEGQPARNPEELVGSAVTGCFSMALSLGLERAGRPPLATRTAASAKLDGDGLAVTTIELTTEADVLGRDADKFTALAEVSRALASVGSITLRATLRAPE